jgi:hypothetical protein
MSVLINGLVHLFGSPGSGKTTFALTASDEPDKVVFLDGDASKGRDMARDIGINAYHDLTAKWGDLTELQYHLRTLDLINRLDNGLDLIIFDNPVNFFRGGHSYVNANREKFRENWSASGKYANMQAWTELRKKHLPSVYTRLQQKAELVIFISHETADYDDDGVKTGLKVAEADESLFTAAGMVIRMTRNTREGGVVPVGLQVKRYRPKFYLPKRKVVNVFPDRIYPCEWSTIEHYLENPVGARENGELHEYEITSDLEDNLIQGSLTEEQWENYQRSKELALITKKEELLENVRSEVVAMAAASSKPVAVMHTEISNQLREKYGNSAPSRSDVARILEEEGTE